MIRAMPPTVIRAMCFGLFVLVLFAGAARAEVYRCTEGGKVTYSDKPCNAGEARSVPVPPPRPTAEAPTVNLQYEAGLGRVAVGMSTTQVEQAWGKPRALNVDVRASGRHEQWVYERNGNDVYVYVDNGKVSSISTRSPAFGKSTADATAPREPTRAEIEASTRAEKAGERKFITNNDRLGRDQVEARIGVPEQKSFSQGFEYWVYLPTRLDYQTRTTVRFDIYGAMIDIERAVQR